MAAINHDSQLHHFWPSKVNDGVECSTNGTASEQNIIDENYNLRIQVEGYVGHFFGDHRSDADVIAVQGHIKRAHWQRMLFKILNILERGCKCMRKLHATSLQPDQDEFLAAVVAFKNLMRHAA